VAIDSPTPSATDQLPIIENEIPAYRAISAMAIVSFLLGLLALLSFANFTFLIAAVAAVVTGILADRKIQRLPDVLTGRGIAQAGVALGLIFGLASVTADQVQSYIRTVEARKFAQQYAGVLHKGSLEQAVWYRLPPQFRDEVKLDQVMETMGKSDPKMWEEKTRVIKEIKSRLASAPGEQIAVDHIEHHGLDGLDPFALVVLRLSGPGSKDFPSKEELALMVVRGKPTGKAYEWSLEDLVYPYKPNTYSLAVKPVDDGHGHGHGH
jgi:hypothetical protein